MIKPEVAKKYNLSSTPTPIYTPSRSKDTNIPIQSTYIPSRSYDTNPPIKSTNHENELVDLLSNLSMNRGKIVKNEKSNVGLQATNQ